MVCAAITFGLAMVAGGVYLTWWNEANLVCQSGAYDKAQAETKSLQTCAADSDLFGKFLHLTCPVEGSLVTSESSTGIAAEGAYRLTLKTEQYGYVKNSETQVNGQTCDRDGKCRDNKETCYCLSEGWTTAPITQGSGSIKYCKRCPANSYNLPPADTVWGSTPTTKLGSVEKLADRVPLGDGTIQIDSSDIPMIANQQLITAPSTPTSISSVNEFELVASEMCGESGNKLMCYKSLTKRVVSGTVNATDIGVNTFGDLRMTVRAYGSTTISAIGKQVSNSDGTASIKSAPFGESKVPPCKSRDIFYAGDGTKSSSEIYQEKHDGLRTLTTILRVVSFVMIFAGFFSVFSPIQDGADMIPCIGDFLAAVVGCVLYIVCALLTLALWFTVFAIAWVFYRPLYGAIFLVLAGLFTAAAIYIGRRQVANKRERSMDDNYPEAYAVEDEYDNEKGY